MKVMTVCKLEEKKEVKLQIRKVSPMWGVSLFPFIQIHSPCIASFPFIILQTKRNENSECSEMKSSNIRDEGR